MFTIFIIYQLFYFSETLIKLGGSNINKKDDISRNVAATAALSYLREITKCILDLTSAVGLISLMNTIVTLQETADEKFDPELGPNFFHNIVLIYKLFFFFV